MPDQTIECKECGDDFIFSEGEQQFYADKQFTTPRRCKTCRDKAKKARQARGEV